MDDSRQVSANCSLIDVHQLEKDCYPPTDSDDDSFVVLEREGVSIPTSSVELLSLNKLEEALESTLESGVHSSCNVSMSTSSSTIDDTLPKITYLVSENIRLTDMVEEGKSKMKRETEKLFEYKQVIDRVYESHKQKFEETKSIISQLQEENKRLKSLVLQEALVESDSSTKEPHAQIQEEQKNILQDYLAQIVSLSNENAVQKEEISNARRDHLNVLRELKKIKEENANLKALLHKESKIDEEEIMSLKEEINSLKQISFQTKTDLDTKNKKLSSIESSHSEAQRKIEELKTSLSKKDEILEKLRDARDKAVQCEKPCNCTTPRTKYLESEIEKLREIIDELGGEKKEWLRKDTERLSQIASQPSPPVLQQQETVDTLKIQLCEAQSCLTDLREKKKNVEKEAEANRNLINELQDQIKNLSVENDKMVALEEQINSNEKDLEIMNQSKQLLVEEMNKISETLRSVQEQNIKLHEENGRLKMNGNSSSDDEAVQPPIFTYKCPICDQEFRSATMLEQHVDECVNTLE